jgi:hypothetical protein
MRRLLVLLAACTAALVVGPLQASAKGPLSPGSYVSQVVSVYEQFAAIVHRDAKRCGRMAVDLQAFETSHKAQLDALNVAAPKISKAEAAAIVMADGGKFAAAATTIGQGLAHCSTNKGVQQMFSALNKIKK